MKMLFFGIILLLLGFFLSAFWMAERHEERMAEMGYVQKVDSGLKLWVKE